MYIKHLIFVIILLCTGLTSYSQTFNYSYTDPCTGVLKTVQVPTNGVTVSYYGQLQTFDPSAFYSGEFDSWMQDVYSSYGGNNPCASIVGLPAAINIAQNTAINFIGIVNSLSALSDMAEAASGGATNLLAGIGSVQNSSDKKEEKKNNSGSTSESSTGSQGQSTQPASGTSESNSNSANTEGSNGSSTSQTGTESTGSGSSTSANSTESSSTGNSSSSNSSNSSNTSGSGTESTSQTGSTSSGTSSEAGSGSSSSTGSSANSTKPEGSTSSTESGSGSSSSESSTGTNGTASSNGSTGTGNSDKSNGSGGASDANNPPSSNSSESAKSETGGGKTNILGGSVSSIVGATSNSGAKSSSNKNGNRPSILANSDFVGFNFKNTDVKVGGKVTGGYSSMRWDGKRAHGVMADYTTALKGPNITGFYAFMRKRRIDLISTTLTLGFDKKTSLYGTLAVGQLYSFKKPKKLKAVWMITASYGNVYGESFIGTAAIVGGMYDIKLSKRIDVKLLGLYVYAPYVSYYNDILLKSPHVVLPIIGTNIAITKRFKININGGGAWAIKENALNYTIMMGTRLAI
jgi:hypothetical protein